MKKLILSIVILVVVSFAAFSQTIRSTTVNVREIAAYEATHPKEKPCSTCPGKEADRRDDEENESWKPIADPNMRIPPGAIIKKQDATLAGTAVSPVPMLASRPFVQDWLGYTEPGLVIPPDTHGAVGLNEVVTATNDFIIVHAKCGGAVLLQLTLDGFTGTFGTCDPYMTFDPTQQRWIFSAIECAAAAENHVILMTSNTADPMGAWRRIDWIPLPGQSILLDHPYLGFDNGRIIMSGRRFFFDGFGYSFVGPSLFLFDKNDMYAGNAMAFGANAQQIHNGTADGDCPLPVTIYDPPFSTTANPAPGTNYILQAWNGSSIRLSTVTGNIPAATWNTGAATFPTSALPSWNNGNIGNAARQSIETRLLAVNDARISCGVLMNGRIWAAHHITFPASGTPDRVAVQWWQLDATPGANFGNVLQNGRVGGNVANDYRWFPSIAVNRTDDVLIGYTRSSNTMHVGAAYVTRQANTPLNTTDDEIIYHGGEDRYWKDFGSGRARWGDYSHTALDPIDNSLWTVQEYAAPGAGAIPPDNNSRYGVWWAQVPQLMTISGGPLCPGPGTYTINNMPPGATVTWESIPNGSIVFSPAGPTTNPSTNATGTINGSATIRATVTDVCGEQTIVTLPVFVGLPIIGGTYIMDGQEYPIHIWFGNPNTDYNNVCNLHMIYTNMSVSGANTVTWSLLQAVPSQPISWGQNGNNLNFYLGSIGQTALFRINATNGCGNFFYDFGFKSIDCSGGGGGCKYFTVAPNPAQRTVKVSLTDKPMPCEKGTGDVPKGITEVNLYNNSGILIRSQKINGLSTAAVDLTGFKTGIYVIEISDGQYKERQQLIVQE